MPDCPGKRYEATLELEWPVEGLEPLSFVLGRLFEPLCAELERDDRAAAVLHVALTLVTRATETRTLNLPAPMRDPRVLRTLVLLHLESHPITAGIDRVTVTADPAPGRIVQFSLLGRSLPLPEQIAPLVARLGALMGEARVGAAALVDSYRPEAFRMTTFSGQWVVGSGQRDTRGPLIPNPQLPTPDSQAPSTKYQALLLIPSSQLLTPDVEVRSTKYEVPSTKYDAPSPRPPTLPPALRRFRFPVPARVVVQDEQPVRVTTDRRGLEGGPVERCAGPWVTSGEWWCLRDARLQARAGDRVMQVGWDREEWDVELGDGSLYRIYRDRDSQRWFVDGIVD